MNLRVALHGEVKRNDARSRSESESEQGVQSCVADAKPSDLPLSRMKSGSVEKLLDEVRVGVKGQSNSEIARTPRNAFRCSLKPKASRGRATDRMRGLHRLSSPDKLRMLDVRSLGVRAWVLRSVPERRTIRTAG